MAQLTSQKYIKQKYRLSHTAFWALLQGLSNEVKKELNLHKKNSWFTPKQVSIIIREFGDFNKYPFMQKSEFGNLYKINSTQLKVWIKNEFGEQHKINSLRHLLTSKEVELLINHMGEVEE